MAGSLGHGREGGRSTVPLWIFSVLGQTGTQTQGVLQWRTERASLLLSQLYTAGRFGELSPGPMLLLTVWPWAVAIPCRLQVKCCLIAPSCEPVDSGRMGKVEEMGAVDPLWES